MSGVESAQDVGEVGFVVAVTAVLSDHQAPAHGITRTEWIRVTVRHAVDEKRESNYMGVVGGLGGLDQSLRGGHRGVVGSHHRLRDRQRCPGQYVSVAIASKLGTVLLDTPVGLPDLGESAAKPGLETPWHPSWLLAKATWPTSLYRTASSMRPTIQHCVAIT